MRINLSRSIHLALALLIGGVSAVRAELPAIGPTADESSPRGLLSGFTVRNLPGSVGEQLTVVDRDLLDLPALDFWVGLSGRFRTASAADETVRALVRPDWSLQLDADRAIGPLFVIATFGRRWGPPPVDTGMRDIWFGWAGLAHRPDADTEVGVIADYRQSVWIGDPALREISMYATRWTDGDIRIRGYVYRTVLEPVTEWGAGIGATYWF